MKNGGFWDERKNMSGRPELVKSFRGEHCLTDAVLYLGEILGDYVAHRIRRAQ